MNPTAEAAEKAAGVWQSMKGGGSKRIASTKFTFEGGKKTHMLVSCIQVTFIYFKRKIGSKFGGLLK